MTHKARDHGVHMHHCNQGEYVGSCKYGQDDRCPALKDSFNQEYKEDLEALGIDVNTHDWQQVFKFFKVVKKEPEENCPALRKYPPKDPKKLTDKKKKVKRKSCTCFIEDISQGHFVFGEMDPDRTEGKIVIDSGCPFHGKLIK